MIGRVGCKSVTNSCITEKKGNNLIEKYHHHQNRVLLCSGVKLPPQLEQVWGHTPKVFTRMNNEVQVQSLSHRDRWDQGLQGGRARWTAALWELQLPPGSHWAPGATVLRLASLSPHGIRRK